jgi:proteasome lid subunit RPN8/RPN11
MAIVMPPALLQQVFAHVRESPDREVCGLLWGEPGRITNAMPTRNVAADPATTFEVDPQALIAALKAERHGGPRLIGHYHSHPNGDPTPSPRDLAASEPGRLWLIVGGDKARLWLARKATFREVRLVSV